MLYKFSLLSMLRADNVSRQKAMAQRTIPKQPITLTRLLLAFSL